MENIGKFSKTGKCIILNKLENDCIECISHSKDDSGYVRIRYNGKHERLFRVLYIKKYGDISKGLVVRHKCDNTWCCNVEHLELGTHKDNMRDMVERNRSGKGRENPKVRGIKNASSKLNNEQVEEIYLSKLSCYFLAKKYGVNKSNILHIRHKRQWKWLTDEIDKKNKK